MLEYFAVKGIYENGFIKLIEKPEEKIEEKTEIIVLIPREHKKGISIKDFLKKGEYCSIGGDALLESEGLYND